MILSKGNGESACGPFRTVLAYQAHRLDPDFSGRFFNDEALRGVGEKEA